MNMEPQPYAFVIAMFEMRGQEPEFQGMIQALTTLAFSTIALLAVGTIVILLRDDWAIVLEAFGYRRADSACPLPIVRAKSARRAVMVRVEIPAIQRRVAA